MYLCNKIKNISTLHQIKNIECIKNYIVTPVTELYELISNRSATIIHQVFMFSSV